MLCELCLSEHAEDALCQNVAWVEQEQKPSMQRTHEPPRRPAPLRNLVGQTLGNYRLVRKLGAGGMGEVYLAEQPLIQARVALKVLHPHLSQDEALRARFYAEARVVNLIGHPNIVRIFDIGEAPGGIHYFVMEYLEGSALSQLPQPMEPGLLIHLLGQACDALEAAHRAGVVHRDLKPDNLYMVQRDGGAPALKVLDFGVAKSTGPLGQSGQTAMGMVLGTPAYMAPEQWVGQPVDGRADIYALGVTGYRLATGRLPFERGQVADFVLSRRHGEPPSPHVLNPSVPKAFSEAVLRALARQPEERFARALDFKRALLSARASSALTKPEMTVLDSPRVVTEPVRGSTVALRARGGPTNASTPAPVSDWVAYVHRRNSSAPVEVRCTELSRGGLFMCCTEPFPRLLTQLEFSLLIAGEPVECVGEVVRHVDAAQARTWGMSPGVGLQFVNPSPRLRELLLRLNPSR